MRKVLGKMNEQGKVQRKDLRVFPARIADDQIYVKLS